MTEAPLADRVFTLVWRGHDLARLRSIGSDEMFWEIFLVESLVTGPLREPMFDAEAWGRCEFTVRHIRTATVLEVFAAPGRTPRPLTADTWTVELRGTYSFAAPEPSVSLWDKLGAMLRRYRE